MKRLLILALAAVCCAAFVFGDHEDKKPITDARHTFLKSLQGTWEATTEPKDHAGIFEYGLSANGSVIVEYLLKGTPMEMLTVYHMNGENLEATHYCMLGNQPQMTAAKEVKENTLTFTCNGKVSNAKSHKDAHIHKWTIIKKDNNNFEYVAKMFQDEKLAKKMVFKLKRKVQK